jgi:DNA-binding transcriptional regulator YiaG
LPSPFGYDWINTVKAIADGIDLDVFKGVFVKTSPSPYRRKTLVASLQRGASEEEEAPLESRVVKVRPNPIARDADEAAVSVRNLRADLGMSQKEFANAYGFSCGADDFVTKWLA